jgi:hypothetical protein
MFSFCACSCIALSQRCAKESRVTSSQQQNLLVLSQEVEIGEALGSRVQNSPPVFAWRNTLNAC